MKEVSRSLKYLRIAPLAYAVKYGDIGDQFFIILRGKVSVWLPVSMKEMHQPLKKLKAAVIKTVMQSRHFNSKLYRASFDFNFHLDPFIEDDDE